MSKLAPKQRLAPPDFYHHAPELHLAFAAVDDEDTLHLVTVDAPDYDCALLRACHDMKEHGVGPEQKIVFLGYAV